MSSSRRFELIGSWFSFTKRILELTKEESDATLALLFRVYTENHDLQVRYKWEK